MRNKYTVNSLKKYEISKCFKQNKPVSMLESINRLEPIKKSKTDIKEDTINHYESEKINDMFNDKHIEYKINVMKIHQSNNILKRLDDNCVIWKRILEHLVNGKLI